MSNSATVATTSRRGGIGSFRSPFAPNPSGSVRPLAEDAGSISQTRVSIRFQADNDLKQNTVDAYAADQTAAATQGKARREKSGSVIPAKQLLELAVLSVKSLTARCRFLGSDRIVSLRSRRPWVPGEIVRVKLRKRSGPRVIRTFPLRSSPTESMRPPFD